MCLLLKKIQSHHEITKDTKISDNQLQSKSEYRNSKQFQKSEKIQNSIGRETAETFDLLSFPNCFDFRISCFEFIVKPLALREHLRFSICTSSAPWSPAHTH